MKGSDYANVYVRVCVSVLNWGVQIYLRNSWRKQTKDLSDKLGVPRLKGVKIRKATLILASPTPLPVSVVVWESESVCVCVWTRSRLGLAPPKRKLTTTRQAAKFRPKINTWRADNNDTKKQQQWRQQQQDTAAEKQLKQLKKWIIKWNEKWKCFACCQSEPESFGGKTMMLLRPVESTSTWHELGTSREGEGEDVERERKREGERERWSAEGRRRQRRQWGRQAHQAGEISQGSHSKCLAYLIK